MEYLPTPESKRGSARPSFLVDLRARVSQRPSISESRRQSQRASVFFREKNELPYQATPLYSNILPFKPIL